MGPVEVIVVIAVIVGIALVLRSIVRRNESADGRKDRGTYSSSAEAAAGAAVFGTTIGHDTDGGDGGGGDGGGGD